MAPEQADAGPRSAARAFVIREDDLSGTDVRALLRFHLAEAQRNSPPGAVFALDLSGLRTPEVTVWTAREEGRLAGIGALKLLGSGEAEVKSMRTHPDFLRRGVGSALLEWVIAAAAERGVRRLSLETGSGPGFAAAVALYARQGFRDGNAFGDYRPNGFSRFMHLDIASPGAADPSRPPSRA
ncbi:MAG: GNAT family N-acetyltransferase [Gluconacetobacter diazotrophicus]|nr:GNAT family N-acetyltransferase [Gluconacetobacter diazotrophicus]